jgi:hypothetical protein
VTSSHQLNSLRRSSSVTMLLFVACATLLAAKLLGCSDHNAQRAVNALDAKSYSDELDACIAAAQDGGAPYSLCEERVDAQHGRKR